ncbi:MAG TPA: hemerythrin domain-containing protein [Bacillota bacterium]|jgi:hemerythrin-like domain-containing protein|nr:hemerythrin domain-containing protein [Bacillota bacterium]
MKYASEDLINEHKGILFGLRILQKIVKTVEQPGEADIKDINDIIDFLRLFADKCHHGKEEGLMFPALEEAGIPNEGGPIGQMLKEHIQGRQCIAEMAASVGSRALQADRFTEAATNYIDLLREHIQKENTVLFPMGDRILPFDKQRQLLEQFEAFEEEVMGKGTHERLHETLHKLGEKYLNTK